MELPLPLALRAVAVRRGSLLLVALFAAAAVLVTEALINLI